MTEGLSAADVLALTKENDNDMMWNNPWQNLHFCLKSYILFIETLLIVT